MKRIEIIPILLAILLAASAICGCGGHSYADPTAEPSEEQVNINAESSAAATAEPTAAPTATPDPVSAAERLGQRYAVSLNDLRIVKNRYYNALDSALSEDNEIAPLLYQMLDYVYGDGVLEAFTDCFGDETAYCSHLEELGYTDISIDRDMGELTVNASYKDSSRVLAASFDGENEAASLTVLQDSELIRFFEWRAVEGGYAIQYAKALPKSEASDGEEDGDPTETEAEFQGYRAYLLADATGSVCAGYYCIGELESILDPPSIDETFIHRGMFSYYTYTLTPETVTVRGGGAEHVHVIGEVSEPEDEQQEDGGDDDGGEEP